MVFKEEPSKKFEFKEEGEPEDDDDDDDEEREEEVEKGDGDSDDEYVDKTAVTCQTCGGFFATDLEYNRHVYNIHLGLFVCCKCGSKFVDEKTIRQHMRDHTLQRNSNNVLVIPNKAVQIRDLAKSGKLIDSRINDKFICKYCDKDFIERSKFFDHYMGHLGRPVKKVPKETQNVVAFNGTPVNNQFRVERLYNDINYLCNLCGKGFNKLAKQRRHQRDCLTKMEWICSVCKYEFKSSNDLFLHFDIAHRHLVRMCKYCFSTYANETELFKHILEEHLDYMYYCYDCNEGFYAYNKYKSHCKIHS